LERGRCPVSNLLRMPFVCVGLDWARPYRPSGFGLPLPTRSHWSNGAETKNSSTDRSKSRWKQNQRANKEEEALHGKPSTAINKACELATTYTTFARHAW